MIDVCLMNPPYNSIHVKFCDKILNYVDRLIVIMPFTFVTNNNFGKQFSELKTKLSERLNKVEEEYKNLFIGTSMPNTAIYDFGDISENIKIVYKNRTAIVKSLNDTSTFLDNEKPIEDIFKKFNNTKIFHCIGIGRNKKQYNENTVKVINKSINTIEEFHNVSFNTYLTCNCANGGMNGKYFSPNNGKIYATIDDLRNSFLTLENTTGYNILCFRSVKAAENCREAMQNYLLRFLLYRLQITQRIGFGCYKYIVDIDWEDDRVKTDEGLLEVCGCPKDKCKEYADYCKKIIEDL